MKCSATIDGIDIECLAVRVPHLLGYKLYFGDTSPKYNIYLEHSGSRSRTVTAQPRNFNSLATAVVKKLKLLLCWNSNSVFLSRSKLATHCCCPAAVISVLQSESRNRCTPRHRICTSLMSALSLGRAPSSPALSRCLHLSAGLRHRPVSPRSCVLLRKF